MYKITLFMSSHKIFKLLFTKKSKLHYYIVFPKADIKRYLRFYTWRGGFRVGENRLWQEITKEESLFENIEQALGISSMLLNHRTELY